MKILVLLSLLWFQTVHALDTKGMKSHGGALIEGVEPVHAFEYMSDQEKNYLILQKEIGRKGNSAIWENVNHLLIPQIDIEDSLFYALCNYKGTFEPKIVAIAKYEEEKELNAIVKKAWIADIEKGQFVSIPVKNIECINEAYGL